MPWAFEPFSHPGISNSQAFFRWQRAVGALNVSHAHVGSTLLDGSFTWGRPQVHAILALRHLVASAGHTMDSAFDPQLHTAGADTPRYANKLFMWAAVHGAFRATFLFYLGYAHITTQIDIAGPGTSHLPHIHIGAAWAGTLYVAVPPGAGSLVVEDPRGGGRPPFHQRRFVKPAVGKMVMFPGWLQHHVTPTQHFLSHTSEAPLDGFAADDVRADGQLMDDHDNQDSAYRVSFSFNVPGSWETSADVNMKVAVPEVPYVVQQ